MLLGILHHRMSHLHSAIAGSMIVLLLVVALVQPCSSVHAGTPQIRYVNPTTGSDTTNDCTSSAAPCQTIAHARDVASGGDTIDLAAGAYLLDNMIYINKNLSITYSGLRHCRIGMVCSATIDAQGKSRAFYIESGATVSISWISITNGKVTNDHGGGIYNAGSLTLDHVRFSNNQVTSSISMCNYDGGGIMSLGTLVITNGRFSSNQASCAGGGLASWDTSLTVSDTVFSNNSTVIGPGGGVYLTGKGTKHLTRVTIDSNTAAYAGGGVSIDVGSPGTVALDDSTISNNSAPYDVGGIAAYSGFNLTNVTMNGNSSVYGAGALYLYEGVNGQLDHVTIAGNDQKTGDPLTKIPTVTGKGVAHLFNSILIGSAPTCVIDSPGGLVDRKRNLVSDATCLSGPNVIQTTDPKLGPLADYGGTTQTIALLAGSPAIDTAYPSAMIIEPNHDQRGYVTSQNGYSDIGAYEYLTPPQIAAAFQPASSLVGEPVDLVVTITNPNTPGVGIAPLEGLAFTVDLPSGLSAISAPTDPGQACSGSVDISNAARIVFAYGRLDAIAGGTANCQIRVTLKPAAPGTFQVTVPPVATINTDIPSTGSSASLDVYTTTFLPIVTVPVHG